MFFIQGNCLYKASKYPILNFDQSFPPLSLPKQCGKLTIIRGQSSREVTRVYTMITWKISEKSPKPRQDFKILKSVGGIKRSSALLSHSLLILLFLYVFSYLVVKSTGFLAAWIKRLWQKVNNLQPFNNQGIKLRISKRDFDQGCRDLVTTVDRVEGWQRIKGWIVSETAKGSTLTRRGAFSSLSA